MSGMLSIRVIPYLVLCCLISSCASKPTVAPVYGPSPPQVEAPPSDASASASPFPQSEPPAVTHPELEEIEKVERPRVGLVVGGAGVASFALIGILKRLKQENISISYIVATGWPALFAVGYSLLPSVHDLEWFAMRLNQRDFGDRDWWRGRSESRSLSSLIRKTFPNKLLQDGSVPVVIFAHADLETPETIHYGPWEGALIKTLKIPELYYPFPKIADKGAQPLIGLGVEEGRRLSTVTTVAINLWEDYLVSLKMPRESNGEQVLEFRRELEESIHSQLANADITVQIKLDRKPSDLSAKRLAILRGYREGVRLVRQIRKNFAQPN